LARHGVRIEGWSVKVDAPLDDDVRRLPDGERRYRSQLSAIPITALLADGTPAAAAEIVRDLALAASGSLNRTVGGPAVYPYINPDLFQSSTSRTCPASG